MGEGVGWLLTLWDTERKARAISNKGEEEKIFIPKMLTVPHKNALTFLTFKQFWDINKTQGIKSKFSHSRRSQDVTNLKNSKSTFWSKSAYFHGTFPLNILKYNSTRRL